MKLSDLFKVSLVAAAVSLSGCGGDLVVKEGDANTTVNEGDTINNNYENGGDNGGDDSSRDDSQNATTGFPAEIDTALLQG
jgi:hypothetical protein